MDIGRFDFHFARAGPDGIDNSFYQWATSGTHRMDKANEWLAFAVGAGEFSAAWPYHLHENTEHPCMPFSGMRDRPSLADLVK